MPAPRSKDEFGLIEAFFAPLARGQPGAFGLRDDAAVVTPGPGRALVATTDLTVAGVHFIADDPPDLVARKSLRVNLSDLAAMGARPIAYLLGLAVPEDRPESWFEAFARGLAEDQEAYGIGLLGGDTTATPGPLCLSVTAFGDVEAGKLLRRRGAAPGDDLYVSGTVGDAALALRRLLGLASEGEAARTAGLSARYRLPEPRGALGVGLAGLASACTDVSDGLVADVGRICAESGVRTEIDASRIPMSSAAAAAVAAEPGLLTHVLTGGDDYELAFCAPPAGRAAIQALAHESAMPATRIGRVLEGEGVAVSDARGRPIDISSPGYRHFSSCGRPRSGIGGAG